MDRRQALWRMGALTGSVAAGIAFSAIGAGCRVHPETDYEPRAFTRSAFDRLGRISDLIIPSTDTPGALDVGVPGFIDELLADVESDENARRFLAAFDDLPDDLPEDLPALERLDARAFADGVSDGDALGDDLWTWRRLKEWTLVGYYTSEEGAAHELHVMPYGPFRGDIPVTKTWA